VHTHGVSVIINVAQEGMQEQWPLRIRDHSRKWHEVYLLPGQMLLYESARLQHERLLPLNGDNVCNLFLSYRPVDWGYKEMRYTEKGLVAFTSKAANDNFYKTFTPVVDPSVWE